MSNIIAVGDIHGSAKWRDIVEENNDATVVFLGDYLDPYGPYNRDDILNNLAEIIEYKRNNMQRVILLLGNHDLHYINYDIQICTRYNIQLAEIAGLLFNYNYNLFQYAYQVNNIIFTHAGISNQWFECDFKGDIKRNIAEQLNNPTDEQLVKMFQIGATRGGDPDMNGGIFWADYSELSDPLHGFTQVVGHNRVPYVMEFEYANDNKILFCDCLEDGMYFKVNV